LTCRSEDPASPRRFPDKTGISPETPSVVFRTNELSPEGNVHEPICSADPCTLVPFRHLPIRAPTSGKLRISSRLAPSLSHRSALQPTGEEDARCVESTSATHTNYVHPHLVRSRLAPLVAQRGCPTESKAPYGCDRGTRCFTTPETASADRSCVLTSSSIPSRAGDTSVGVFFPRRSGDRASDTPVAKLSYILERFLELPRGCLLLRLCRPPAFLRVGTDRRMWSLA